MYVFHYMPGMYLTLAGKIISNNSFVYYDEIGRHERSSALICHTNNSDYCHNRDNTEGCTYEMGNWYFPNGNTIPSHNGTQWPSSMFTERSQGEVLLLRVGHPSITGRYLCRVFNTDINELLYVNIGKEQTCM